MPSPGSFELCPVCYWEDDSVQFSDPEFRGGANAPSLAEARENFARLGASSPEVLQLVRPALASEQPPQDA
jgi:hypothetical protein